MAVGATANTPAMRSASKPTTTCSISGGPSRRADGRVGAHEQQLQPLFGVVGGMDESGWSMPAEGPAGHLPIHLILRHRIWDAWVHERDIVLPLGLTPVVEPDEVEANVVFVGALSPAMSLLQGVPIRGEFILSTGDPSSHWTIEVADQVSVRIGGEGAGAPCLAGRAVDLAEALSLRAPLPPDAPDRWRDLLGGLATAFDAGEQADRIPE
jgi:hypothetical protein